MLLAVLRDYTTFISYQENNENWHYHYLDELRNISAVFRNGNVNNGFGKLKQEECYVRHIIFKQNIPLLNLRKRDVISSSIIRLKIV